MTYEDAKEQQQASCRHHWVHLDVTAYGRLTTSTYCRKCHIVPAEEAARKQFSR